MIQAGEAPHPPQPKPAVAADLQGVVEKEHQRLLARKLLIEKRKEVEEMKLVEKVRVGVGGGAGWGVARLQGGGGNNSHG